MLNKAQAPLLTAIRWQDSPDQDPELIYIPLSLSFSFRKWCRTGERSVDAIWIGWRGFVGSSGGGNVEKYSLLYFYASKK
jgi:hypothetical protein